MNISTKQKQTHRHKEETCGRPGGGGRGTVGGMGLAYTHDYRGCISYKGLLYSTGEAYQIFFDKP